MISVAQRPGGGLVTPPPLPRAAWKASAMSRAIAIRTAGTSSADILTASWLHAQFAVRLVFLVPAVGKPLYTPKGLHLCGPSAAAYPEFP
jgi:hypothetical protein